jgi:tRNA-Thr(GGU) m(6)t(6)A37 methyltransferase TsaA
MKAKVPMNSSEKMKIEFSPIGIIHSPFKDLEEMPIQPSGKASSEGAAEIFAEYLPGLKDLDGFSHVILIYYLHAVKRVDLQVTPFLDEQPRGIFATRAPTRPNPIGLSIVRINRVKGTKIFLSDIDILDGTPLLDIKPYVPDFDQPDEVKIGWLQSAKAKVRGQKSDDRFK